MVSLILCPNLFCPVDMTKRGGVAWQSGVAATLDAFRTFAAEDVVEDRNITNRVSPDAYNEIGQTYPGWAPGLDASRTAALLFRGRSCFPEAKST